VAELLAAFTYTPQQRWGPVSPHGIGTALGFFLGAWLMARRAEPRGIPRPEVYNAVTWGALGAIIGARGFYVIAHIDTYQSVGDMLKVWEGGLTMFGGFVGGLAFGLGYLRSKRFHIPTALDSAAPGFVVGVLIGRIGDIVIADHLGERTGLPFGFRVPNAELAPGYGPPYYTPGVVVHHTALYDFIGALVLLGFLYWLEKRKPRTGVLFATFSLWYGLQRFIIDFTRNRLIIESSYFGLSGSQWAGLAFAVGGLYWLIRIRRARAVVVPEGATLGGTEAEIAAAQSAPPLEPSPAIPSAPPMATPEVMPPPPPAPAPEVDATAAPPPPPPAPAPPPPAPDPSPRPSVPSDPQPEAPPSSVPAPPVAPPIGAPEQQRGENPPLSEGTKEARNDEPPSPPPPRTSGPPGA
jgi:phosphatidylglycerol:prolipoprotein diacylglycerol transferase